MHLPCKHTLQVILVLFWHVIIYHLACRDKTNAPPHFVYSCPLILHQTDGKSDNSYPIPIVFWGKYTRILLSI